MNIAYAIFDVDGVFTDGSFYYSTDGKVLKRFGPHDNDGLKLLVSKKIQPLAISADKRGFEITKKRMQDMGIPLHLVSEEERYKFVTQFYNPNKIFFMGDGVYDAAVMAVVRLSAAPANATIEAKCAASFVTMAEGGSGAVYEACKTLLKITERI
jgi:3-deoxy-D-manno-octulosonate 8-phosphate phosphatase (KDO 8-P phosphatase)